MKAAHADPPLRAAHAAHMAKIEAGFASALAERLGTDPDRDPYPLVLASAATGILRATMSFWAATGGRVPLEQLTDAAFQALADGFPENSTLRRLASRPLAGHSERPQERPASDEPCLAPPPEAVSGTRPGKWRRAAGETPARAGDGNGALPGLSHRSVLLIIGALMLGMLLAALDQTIVSTALRPSSGTSRAARTSPGSSPRTCWRPPSRPRCGASSATSTAGRSSSRPRS